MCLRHNSDITALPRLVLVMPIAVHLCASCGLLRRGQNLSEGELELEN